eukprot:NODE_10200_length_1369_cov_9.553945.p1 GENE.NODE_10200_length_1369_cov_9.553945~~NODE_10200_length_1369_cov_9.553945.p1  ORF type:complete len:289 (-),score=46.89 NODE_10200_length_1369_cov_9.553945:301-1167(-)
MARARRLRCAATLRRLWGQLHASPQVDELPFPTTPPTSTLQAVPMTPLACLPAVNRSRSARRVHFGAARSDDCCQTELLCGLSEVGCQTEDFTRMPTVFAPDCASDEKFINSGGYGHVAGTCSSLSGSALRCGFCGGTGDNTEVCVSGTALCCGFCGGTGYNTEGCEWQGDFGLPGVPLELTLEQRNECKKAFNLLGGGFGAIDPVDLKAVLRHEPKLFGIEKSKPGEIAKMIDELQKRIDEAYRDSDGEIYVDGDGSGAIEFPEFLKMMTALKVRSRDPMPQRSGHE